MSRAVRIASCRTGAFLGLLKIFCAAALALSNSTGPNGCNAQAVHALGYTGQGVLVGLISQSHARYTHEAFSNTASWYDATGLNIYEPVAHDTSMAGIVCSRGGTNYPDHKGVAPGANLLTVRITQPVSGSDARAIDFGWVSDALNKIKSDGGRIIVTGIQLTGTTDGSSAYSLIYDYYAYTNNIIFATAAGNASPSITIFGDTFNSVTTGGLIRDALNAYSQVGTTSISGPTVDGRRKPEVAAPSTYQVAPTDASDISWGQVAGTTQGYTSWSVPHTGGVAALLLSYADTTTDTADNKSEVIKAVIVNSTFPNILAKNGTWTDPKTNTWHPDRGYGRIDALRAYQTLSAPKVTYGTNITQPKGWTYRYFNQSGLTDSYWIHGAANARLTTTLTWHRKVNKTGNKYSAETDDLNLDLKIFHEDDTTPPIFSDTLAATAIRNNLRKADILLPVAGYYEVRVTNTTNKLDRAYALAFEVLEPLSGDWNNDYAVNLADLSAFLQCWLTECDLITFEELASHWLMVDPRYAMP